MKHLIFKISTLLFLSTFIFIKVINAHGINHLSDDKDAVENCQYCEFYYSSDKVADLSLSIPVFENPNEPVEVVYQVSYTFTSFLNTTYPGQYHNRPPPIFL